MRPSSDNRIEALIERIASGERTALRSLYNETGARLLGVATRLMANRNEGETIVRETFVAVWQNASSYDRRSGSGWVWLLTVLRSTAYRRLRAATREAAFMDGADHDQPGADASFASGVLERLGDDLVIKQSMQQLDQEEQHSILMAYIEGQSTGQIADRLDISFGNVRSIMRHGLQRLREMLS